MRVAWIAALVAAVVCLAMGWALIAIDHDRARTRLERELHLRAEQHAGEFEAYAARARSIVLLTAAAPAFARFADHPGSRTAKLRALPGVVRDGVRSLRALESQFPGSIGEACFIDRNGDEIARVVHGRAAPAWDLSHAEEHNNPAFAPTFALHQHEVHQTRPYVSADTGEWVVANATPVPSRDGVNRAILHYELTIESFRQAAATTQDGFDVRVIDGRTGAVLIDGAHPQRRGAALGVPGDHRFAEVAAAPERDGVVEVGDRVGLFERVRAATGDVNDWIVLVTAPASPASSVGSAPIVLLIAGALLLVFGVVSLRASPRTLERAADTDALTGLPNRRRLMADLAARVTAAQREPTIVALFDLNGFKHYNDTFGHQAGDALLTRLGHALARDVAPHGQAYRLGGDEFCVVAAAAAGERVEAAARAALSERGEDFEITASSGAAVVPDEAGSAGDALRLADQRMYARKSSGRWTARRQSADVLLCALSERHPDLERHGADVAELATAVGRGLGLDGEALDHVRHAAELHDVGKVAIPEAIPLKPGPLDDDEWAFMRRHTVIGERIIAVCDAFDAMVTDRPYCRAASRAAALDELRRCAGTQFDPAVVAEFERVVLASASAANPASAHSASTAM
jgi:diguanylate cyclase (GGDEF)-like protein